MLSQIYAKQQSSQMTFSCTTPRDEPSWAYFEMKEKCKYWRLQHTQENLSDISIVSNLDPVEKSEEAPQTAIKGKRESTRHEKIS